MEHAIHSDHANNDNTCRKKIYKKLGTNLRADLIDKIAQIPKVSVHILKRES